MGLIELIPYHCLSFYFFRSGNSVVLFDTPDIFKCHNTLFVSILMSKSSKVLSVVCVFPFVDELTGKETSWGQNISSHCRYTREQGLDLIKLVEAFAPLPRPK